MREAAEPLGSSGLGSCGTVGGLQTDRSVCPKASVCSVTHLQEKHGEAKLQHGGVSPDPSPDEGRSEDSPQEDQNLYTKDRPGSTFTKPAGVFMNSNSRLARFLVLDHQMVLPEPQTLVSEASNKGSEHPSSASESPLQAFQNQRLGFCHVFTEKTDFILNFYFERKSTTINRRAEEAEL